MADICLYIVHFPKNSVRPCDPPPWPLHCPSRSCLSWLDHPERQCLASEGVSRATTLRDLIVALLTTLSLAIEAKPEFSVPVWPPLDAMFWTSSLERLAKLPGLLLSAIVMICEDVFVV